MVTESEEDLKNHISLNHKKETEQTKIKLELFAIDVSSDVIEAEQKIIEKLLEQDEVDKVLKLYIDKMVTYVDVHNVYWNAADLIISTNKKANLWEETKSKKNIYSKCYLWEIVEAFNGDTGRDEIKRRQEMQRAHMRPIGYFPGC